MQKPWATSGLAIALASLLALSCSSGCSAADVTATSLSATDASMSFAASSAPTSALEPGMASTTAPYSASFASVEIPASTTDAPLETADVDTQDADTEVNSFTASTNYRYPGHHTQDEELQIRDCSFTKPICVCEKAVIMYRCRDIQHHFWSWCRERFPMLLFCGPGEEHGPPGRSWGPPKPFEPLPPPKKTKNCMMDGISPDDCETRVGHMPTKRAERTPPSTPTTFATIKSAANL